eukprot:CAMPEP_0180808406 /NCGR_PEP_ID=MMETSP1038_2-20121128/63777_1 /TAXON_ID=632150 /ORGANISM="Azadinium spinosum, Strain 3D9" /LENGTH=47 /DNA_ID= /DNA_START= /DNA_END= /DNA_ORIENTATION=
MAEAISAEFFSSGNGDKKLSKKHLKTQAHFRKVKMTKEQCREMHEDF